VSSIKGNLQYFAINEEVLTARTSEISYMKGEKIVRGD
jgi:hypothetical protein